MGALGIDVLGLPGARLREGFQLPSHWGLRVAARGGPSYASVAVIWKAELDHVMKVRERRLDKDSR